MQRLTSRPQRSETTGAAETAALLARPGSYGNYGQVRGRARPAGDCAESA